MYDVKTQEEKYAQATVTGSLTGEPESTLIAAGMVGSRHGVATSTWRLVDGMDAKNYGDVVSKFAKLVLQQAQRQKAQCTNDDARKVATMFAGYLVCPICPTCQGRGASLIGDAKGGRGVLADACPTCHGTGRRNLRRMAQELGPVLQDLTLWLNGEVLSQSVAAQVAMRRKKRQ